MSMIDNTVTLPKPTMGNIPFVKLLREQFSLDLIEAVDLYQAVRGLAEIAQHRMQRKALTEKWKADRDSTIDAKLTEAHRENERLHARLNADSDRTAKMCDRIRNLLDDHQIPF